MQAIKSIPAAPPAHPGRLRLCQDVEGLTDATVRAASAHEYDARQRRTQKSNAGRADVGPAGGKEAIALRQRGRQLGCAIGRPGHRSGAHSGAALHTQQQQRRPSTFGPLLVSLPLWHHDFFVFSCQMR